MSEPASIAPTRTVEDVFGRVEIPDGFESYAKIALDELSHDEYGFLIQAALELRTEVENVENALTEAWASRYEMLADGGVARRSA